MKNLFITILGLLILLSNNTFSLQISICGNKSCEKGENIDSCKEDCNLFLSNNNGVCGFQENYKNSPNDCNINCGDGKCEINEIYNCPKDCLGNGSLLTKEKSNINTAVTFY